MNASEIVKALRVVYTEQEEIRGRAEAEMREKKIRIIDTDAWSEMVENAKKIDKLVDKHLRPKKR